MAASTFLNKTFSSNPTNGKKWTISLWYHLAPNSDANNQYYRIWSAGPDVNNRADLNINDPSADGTSAGLINFTISISGTGYTWSTQRGYVDMATWYHMVLAFDSTEGNAADRVKMWINNELQTYDVTPTLPADSVTEFAKNGVNNDIGKSSHYSPRFFHGTMSHFYFIDGTALTPSTFGSTDATTGEWKINVAPSGLTYGTNGFLIMKDSNTITDQSPNSNDWSLGGGTLTNMQDNPSNAFCTMHPMNGVGTATYKVNNCGTTVGDSGSGDNDCGMTGTLGMESGKYYWEVKAVNAGGVLGIKNSDVGLSASMTDGSPNAGYWGFQSNGSGYSLNTYINGTFNSSNTLQGHDNNDIVMVAVDMDNGKLFYGRNGSWLGADGNAADPVAGTNAIATNIPQDGTFMLPWTEHRSSGDPESHFNFGNGFFGTTAISSAGSNASNIGVFEYDVPTGFTALSTKGLNN